MSKNSGPYQGIAATLLALGLATSTLAVASPGVVRGETDGSAPSVVDLEPTRDSRMHLKLDRSEPAADATIEQSPETIRLWFSQSPQIAGTSVRVVPSGGEPMEVEKAVLADEDDKLVLADVLQELSSGAYTVHWRAMAADGHIVRGEFDFRVRIAR